jgi:preprotein translocase subunit SecD
LRSGLRWKGAVIFGAFLIFALLIIPINQEGDNLFGFEPLRLGLDLKGGIELLLAPDYRMSGNVLNELGTQLNLKIRAAQIAAPTVDYLGTLDNERYEGLKFTFATPDDAQRAVNVGAFPAKFRMDVAGETKDLRIKTKISGRTAQLTVTQEPPSDAEDALKRSLTIINHRISEKSSGMAEADVRLDGEGRINAQLPGIKTLEDARRLIVATGRLTFRINNKIVLDGAYLDTVTKGYEPGEGYVINFSFKSKGAKMLDKITTENVGKVMAIYLDDTSLMEPEIKEPIPNGSGRITLGRTTEAEVDQNVILMRSGALPISLRVVQSTQVAPTLGKEIIKQSVFSGILGIVLVLGFMVIFYGAPGLLANAALGLYALFVLGIMALFRGVITLPGVAGLILGMGMAVDANIIIFERIKDELRNGKRVRPAVQAGFDRAFWTILDANITTLIAAAVLFRFGSGPVQGFAVTLFISIVISMITAIYISRFFLEWRIDQDPDRYAKYFGIKEVSKA